MTETTIYSPDQQFRPSQSGELFATHEISNYEAIHIPESAVKGADDPETARRIATADAYAQAESGTPLDRYVVEPREGLQFVIDRANPNAQVVPTELNQPVADLYDERQVQERRRVAAEQKEAEATNEQLRYSIECDTITMATTQNYVETYGFDAGPESRDKFGLAA